MHLIQKALEKPLIYWAFSIKKLSEVLLTKTRLWNFSAKTPAAKKMGGVVSSRNLEAEDLSDDFVKLQIFKPSYYSFSCQIFQHFAPQKIKRGLRRAPANQISVAR